MIHRIEIETGPENYGMYYDEQGKRKISFDFQIVSNEITLFPESFSNWINDYQEKLTVFEYITVIKRIMKFFKTRYPNHYVLFN